MQKFGPYNFVRFNNNSTNDSENSGQNGIADFLNMLGQNNNSENNTNENPVKEQDTPQNTDEDKEEFITPKNSTHFVSDQKKLLTAIKPNDKIAPKPNFHLWE